jgi:hypothetical protein
VDSIRVPAAVFTPDQGGGLYTGPGGGFYTGPGGGLYTGPGGGLYTGPGGGLYTGPGGGLYRGPGGYKRNIPPVHIFIKVLEQRGLDHYVALLRRYYPQY